jgi:hypothetical protein
MKIRDFAGPMSFNQIEKAKTKDNYYYVGLVHKSRKRKVDESGYEELEDEEEDVDELDYIPLTLRPPSKRDS